MELEDKFYFIEVLTKKIYEIESIEEDRYKIGLAIYTANNVKVNIERGVWKIIYVDDLLSKKDLKENNKNSESNEISKKIHSIEEDIEKYEKELAKIKEKDKMIQSVLSTLQGELVILKQADNILRPNNIKYVLHRFGFGYVGIDGGDYQRVLSSDTVKVFNSYKEAQDEKDILEDVVGVLVSDSGEYSVTYNFVHES